jgi:hypothetical protein
MEGTIEIRDDIIAPALDPEELEGLRFDARDRSCGVVSVERDRHSGESLEWLASEYRSPLGAVEGELAVGDDGDVAASVEELHHALAGARKLCPARFGVGVLLETAELPSFERKIHLDQAAAGCAPDGNRVTFQFDGLSLVDQGLLPNRNQRV